MWFLPGVYPEVGDELVLGVEGLQCTGTILNQNIYNNHNHDNKGRQCKNYKKKFDGPTQEW